MNNFSGIGRIAMDPKIGDGVVSSLLAVKRIYNSKDGSDTDFIPITLFGKKSDNFSKMVQKGDKIGIDGSIKTSRYADENGKVKYNWSIVVSHFYLLDSKPKTEKTFTASLTADQIATLSTQLAAASNQARESLTSKKVF